MKVDLPQKFVEKMKWLLGDEYDAFIASYDNDRYHGLRVNELKISTEEWLQQTDMKDHLSPIPWCKQAFYYTNKVRPAKHPHYHAGLYYIQEPTAMVPVELLDVQPGHRVLDLCAAPGGKSTQIASKLQGQGTLISNDIATERTKPLVKNIELAGVRNAVVLNESPNNIAKHFSEWFDRILIDAPCSGEGMFRKSPDMINEWEEYSVERCAAMQKDILEVVATMLAPGGKIVYSTCTFSPEENEDQIAKFLINHPDFSVDAVNHQWGWASGNPDWVSGELREMLAENQLQSISGTVRLWPHKTQGEGHFVAVLSRSGESNHADEKFVEQHDLTIHWPESLGSTGKFEYHRKKENSKEKSRYKVKSILQVKQAPKRAVDFDMKTIFNTFEHENLSLIGLYPLKASIYGSRISLQSTELPSLDGLKVARAGWNIGEVKHNKFIPYHALAMAIHPDEALRFINFEVDNEQVYRYLKGETIFIEQEQLECAAGIKKNGYVLICVNKFPIGFGKNVDGMIKNDLPVGWRMI